MALPLPREPRITYLPVGDELRGLAAIPGTRDLLVSFGTELARMSLDGGAAQPIEHGLTDRWGDTATVCALTAVDEHQAVLATIEALHRVRFDDGATGTGTRPRTRTSLRSEVCTAGSVDLAASADGDVAAATAYDYLVAVAGTKETIVHEPENRFWGVAVNADGSLLANGREDGTVELGDPATLAVERTLTGLSVCVLAMSFSPSGDILVAGDDLHGLCSWNLVTGEKRQHEMHAKAVDVSWLPDESGFLVTGLTRMLMSFSPKQETGDLLIFDGLGTRYFQGAALAGERTLAICLEQSRSPELDAGHIPASACVMAVELG